MVTVLSRAEWRERQRRHCERLRPYADDYVHRRHAHRPHPVYDFLFEYYSFRPAHLLRWSPGFGIVLADAQPNELDWGRLYRTKAHGLTLDPADLPAPRRGFVDWAISYLQSCEDRPPHFGCFGLHEWAMVYRTPEIRHRRVPLRLSDNGVADVVESLGLCCTHFDAFRFFTPAAEPKNLHRLSRRTTEQFDQPACVHVTMDLYKYAYKIAPWLHSDITADAFVLARRTRELDMRASPYDLVEFGLDPIRIETLAGRAEYVAGQQELMKAAKPLRQRLVEGYRGLTTAADQ